ncbi:unnamed protein product [Urochloa humidicola]
MAAATPDYIVSGVMKQSSNKRRWSLPSPASSSSSHSGSTTTTQQQQQQQDEEADMARCLILLAQGPCAAVSVSVEPPMTSSSNKRRSSYECKTCNRCFPSFQALGGHRTSHNNNAADSKKNKPRRPEPAAAEHAVTTTLSLRPAAAAAHECSACGAAFASGQALGGHMRRHRPLTAAAPESVVTAEERSNVVSQELDLNLLPGPSTEQEVTSPAKGIMHHFKH